MPKVDRSEIEQVMLNILSKRRSDRKFLFNLNQALSKRNIPLGTFTDIVMNAESSLSTIDLKLLSLIMIEVYKETGESLMNPSDYFHAKEINASENYNGQIESNRVELPLTIENVIKVQAEDYLTAISGTELIRLYKSQLIEYDFETQRSPKYKGIIEFPDINLKSVQEISEIITNDLYLPDTLTLNVYSEEAEPVSYNERLRTLVIHKGARITILDGFHRLQGLVRAHTYNKNIEVMFNLAIKSYDKETAKKYFGRINKINQVKKARIDELMQDRSADKIVKELIRNSELKGKVASTDKIVQIHGHLTTTAILANAIDYYYGNLNFIETKKISKYLEEFFNYLLGYFPEAFRAAQSIHKREDYTAHPLIFAGYIWLSKYFLDKGISADQVDVYVRKIDFQNPKLNELFAVKSNLRIKRARQVVEDYFKPFIVE